MFKRIIQLVAAFFSTAPASPPSWRSVECAEFAARAAAIRATWDRVDCRNEALVLLAMYPHEGCAPAERFVLAKRALDRATPDAPIVELLLRQGLREQRGAISLVNLVAQVDLLVHLAERELIRLSPCERARLDRLARRTDRLIEKRSDAMIAEGFAEYASIARSALSRGGGRSILRR